MTLYRETKRAFSKGERVQFTAPNREQRIANRELGTIEKIEANGSLQLRTDSGRSVTFNHVKENPHLDYGYAVTSHSSQGQTAAREKLVNRRLRRLAYAVSLRCAGLYNDKSHLAGQLSRDVSHRSAMEPDSAQQPAPEKIEVSAPSQPQAMAAQAQSIGR